MQQVSCDTHSFTDRSKNKHNAANGNILHKLIMYTPWWIPDTHSQWIPCTHSTADSVCIYAKCPSAQQKMYLCLAQHTFPAAVQMFLELALTSYWTVCRHATWFFAMGATILDPSSWKFLYLAHGQLIRMPHGSSSILECFIPKFQTPTNTHKCSRISTQK